MQTPLQQCQQWIDKRSNDGLLRERKLMPSNNVDFSSNDYLGLSKDERLITAYQNAVGKWGVGSGGSPLVSGYQQPHHELEEEIKDWLGVEAVMLFSSGFSANSALMQFLLKTGFHPFLDKLSHASILSGAGLLEKSRDPNKHSVNRYKHNDFNHLRRLVDQPETSDRFPLVVTEGVFSMDGDFLDYGSCKDLGIPCWVDDAHTLGWFGKQGEGSVSQLPKEQLTFVTGTFGKALGCHGAFVAGPSDWVEGMVNYAPEYIYSTAMPAALAATVQKAIQIVRSDNSLQEKLMGNIKSFNRLVQEIGLSTVNTITRNDLQSPIQPIKMQDLAQDPLSSTEEMELLTRCANALQNNGLQCGLIRPPTVAQGSSRLRVSLSATHSLNDIEHLLGCVSELVQ
ncbi:MULTISPECIES: 8-amino-7-oxononanoate synthase [Gammaproteobacteria]|uniref:aminotransferase class I/II-fold pyridoxal phosphate-dependent enzyme n=1 Tax=Gammaproteobacteria TaxID=1236 RepID=UPI000DD0D1EB|nr:MULTISPECIES: 8-amino-7-oxononanoate synthase [Gammaproteobacteria]RTE87267.1 8-amino-7-oxononanoate synthase [Aliidiomarina sp. B3213]TCZ92946.1 8-amino-7-oxononanoate synthase [Lysobacter sp. N42]